MRYAKKLPVRSIKGYFNTSPVLASKVIKSRNQTLNAENANQILFLFFVKADIIKTTIENIPIDNAA